MIPKDVSSGKPAATETGKFDLSLGGKFPTFTPYDWQLIVGYYKNDPTTTVKNWGPVAIWPEPYKTQTLAYDQEQLNKIFTTPAKGTIGSIQKSEQTFWKPQIPYHSVPAKSASDIYNQSINSKFISKPKSEPPKTMAKSQKILGLQALQTSRDLHWGVYCGVGVSLPLVVTKEADIDDFYFDFPAFARGCPLRPRHGFVDSVVVKNLSELRDVWKKVREADPEGEMLVGEFIDSSHNIIWTPTGMAIGPSNDGATAGRESIFIPLIKGSWTTSGNYRVFMERAKIAKGEVPYIEAVVPKGSLSDTAHIVEATQCRSGPLVDSLSADYIPKEMTVLSVVDAEGDLLEWEAKAARFTPGTVVYHPGGTMASHYSVHGVNHGIPVIISFKPKAGDVLKPTSGIKELDLGMLEKGIIAGHAIPLKRRYQWKAAVSFLLTALHNANAQRGEHSWAIGAASSLMTRIGLGLACGELRHSTQGSVLGPYVKGKNRDQIYTEAFNDYFVYRLLYTHTMNSYFNKQWSSSYGGKAWGNCSMACAKLDTAVGAFMQDPSDKTSKALVDSLNSAVNQAHNGGWWLNKIVDQKVMEAASTGMFGAALASASTYYETLKLIRVETGGQTIGPLLRFLPPIIDEIEAMKVKIKVTTQVPTGEDVPQLYSLKYPEPLAPKPEYLGPVFMRTQIRPADEKLNIMRFQVQFKIGAVLTKHEHDFTLSSEKYVRLKEVFAATETKHNSFHEGSGAHYIEWPVEISYDSPTAVCKATLVFAGETKNTTWSIYVPGKPKPIKPLEWWKPGVVIPVKWDKKFKEEVKEVEVYASEVASYEGSSKICDLCGEHPVKQWNTYCDPCFAGFNECEECGEKSASVTDGDDCPNCGYSNSPKEEKENEDA